MQLCRGAIKPMVSLLDASLDSCDLLIGAASSPFPPLECRCAHLLQLVCAPPPHPTPTRAVFVSAYLSEPSGVEKPCQR